MNYLISYSILTLQIKTKPCLERNEMTTAVLKLFGFLVEIALLRFFQPYNLEIVNTYTGNKNYLIATLWNPCTEIKGWKFPELHFHNKPETTETIELFHLFELRLKSFAPPYL